MTEEKKKRSAASEALIALRKAMGKTQQTFAVEVLKTAIGTIARYESSDPPRGEVLMRLSRIAREQGLVELSDRFRGLYAQDAVRAIGAPLSLITDKHGYMTTELSSERAVRLAYSFVNILFQLDKTAIADSEKDALVESVEAAVRKTKVGAAVANVHDHQAKKGAKR